MTWLWETSDIIYCNLHENLSCRIKILNILRYVLLLSFFLTWVAQLFYRPALLIVKIRDLTLRHFILLHVIRFHFSMRLWNENTVRSKRIEVLSTFSSGNIFDVGCLVYSITKFRLPAGYKSKPVHLIVPECTSHGRQVARGTTLCAVATNKCGSSEWNLFCFAILVPRISKWSLDF
jgi:hypothetical protein